MFALDNTIDSIQTSQKTFVKTFVQNETIADTLNKLVDTNAEYSKKAVKLGADTMATLVEEATKFAQTAGKFDYAKMVEEFTPKASKK
jgi:hypothetical protein